MIVGRYFDGDNDKDLQSQQHDCYGEALRIIAHGSAQGYRNATLICDVEDSISKEDRKKLSDGFDHRTLQMAHDHLAAYWRWHSNRRDPYLDGMEPCGISNWLSWLRREVELWPTLSPSIVRNVAVILMNQNTDTGYKAEDELLEALKGHYSGMPEIDYCQENSAQETIDVTVINQAQRQTNDDSPSILNRVGTRFLHACSFRGEYKELFTAFGGLILITIFMLIIVVGIITVSGFFDFSFYVGYGEEAPARVALQVIMISAFLFATTVWVLVSSRAERYRYKDHNIKYIEETRLSDDIRPWWLGALWCLVFSVISILIDFLSAHYLYRDDANIFLQMALTCVYGACAFFIFYLWAVQARFGPFSEK